MRIATLAVSLALPTLSPGQASADQDRTAICQQLSAELVQRLSAAPHSKDYRLYHVDAFYSEKLDTCVHLEGRVIGVEVMVRDLTESVLRNEMNRFPPLLLHCDVDGIDEVIIAVVKTYGGRVDNVPYKKWLTDGQGGPPRTLKTPDRPLVREDCDAALVRWLAKWG